MNKKLIWGIVIVIVVVVGIAYFNSSIAKPVCWPYCENMTDQDREKIKESAISDWKTYSNEKYGFGFKYPQNYVLDRENTNGFLVMFRDQSKVFPNLNVANLIMVGARSAKNELSFDNYIKKYPILDANSNRPYTFIPRVLGKNTFYYTLTERFEGTLSFMYCTLNNDTVLCFYSESNGVAWSDVNLDVEADSTHSALRDILSTFKFTN